MVDSLEPSEAGEGWECCCDCFGSLGFDVVPADAEKRNRSSGDGTCVGNEASDVVGTGKVVVVLLEEGEAGKLWENCRDCHGSCVFDVVAGEAAKRNRSSGDGSVKLERTLKTKQVTLLAQGKWRWTCLRQATLVGSAAAIVEAPSFLMSFPPLLKRRNRNSVQ